MFTFPNSARMPERTVWSQGAEVKCLKSQSTWEATAFDFSLTETTDGKRLRVQEGGELPSERKETYGAICPRGSQAGTGSLQEVLSGDRKVKINLTMEMGHPKGGHLTVGRKVQKGTPRL